MTQQSIAALQKDNKFEGFLLVRSAEQRVGSNGSSYLDLTLGDKTGDMNAKVWNTTAPAPRVGTVLKVRATITEYNSRLQMRVEKYRASQKDDEVDFSQLVATAPEPPEDMLDEVIQAIEGMTNPVLKQLTSALVKKAGEPLLYFPAAQRLHHATRSGLLHHITSMLRVAEAILPCYPFLDVDLVKAGIIVHDLSKLGELKSDELGNVRDYTQDGILVGHLVRGVSLIEQTAQELGFSYQDEYVMLLEHMVISHHGVPEYGSPRPPMFPEAEMLHWIDVVDARMNEMQGVLQRLKPGVFSEKIWSLERRLYHPRYLSEADLEDVEFDGTADEEYQAPDADNAYERLL